MLNYIKTILEGGNLSLGSVSSIQISDIVDILLVAYLIYVVITWIQQTRAWSVFKGIGVIILIMGLSQLLQLNAIYWIISNAFSVGILAIVVLFQPELRRALEQIGKGGTMSRFFSTGSAHELTRNTVTEVIAAAKTMARVKTGALIVLEQRTPLGDYENTGISIDALVSAELLINIFENKTPLHDGAVIIRNNRVAAATCILPLTQEEIGKELGTRHRAAVGTSEASDAYILVVSEETGQISIASGGKLSRDLTEEQMLGILLNESVKGNKENLRRRSTDEKTD